MNASPGTAATAESPSKGFQGAVGDARHDLALMWRSGGIEAVRDAILHRSVHRVYRRRRFLVLKHDLLADPVQQVPPSGVEIRSLSDRDSPSLPALVITRAIELFRRRAAAGRTCLLAWRARCPIGHAWMSERIDPEIESYPIPLPSDSGYLWDLYVDPEERRGGVGAALVAARVGYARERGLRRGWNFVAPDNPGAIRAAAKGTAGGVRVVGTATLVRVLGRARAG